MLQIETQGASELVSFRQKPTAGSLSTRQLRRNEGGKGRLEKKKRGGGVGRGGKGGKQTQRGNSQCSRSTKRCH